MARLFDTTFDYKGEPYTAVVTIVNSEEETKISIHVPDKSLESALPGGKLILTESQVTDHTQHCSATADPDLINSLKEAVEHHEKDKPSLGLWC
ncbi:MAG TPA: hypothetical protein VF610_12440 [Segetibacter sp.]|jgi:hypothetical protein